MLPVNAIDHIVVNVRNVEASASWYERVLGMRREDLPAPSGRVRTSLFFGDNKINLRPVDASQTDWFTADAPQAGSDDLCFLTAATPEQVTGHLQRCGVSIERGPVERDGARGPIRSVYVRDPDGNLIEVSSYATD